MITEENVFGVGRVVKSHGLGGDLVVKLYNDILNYIDVRFLFFEINSLFVPFECVSVRPFNEDSAIFSLKQIKTKEAAAFFRDLELFILKTAEIADIDYHVLSWIPFVDYKIYDQQDNYIGTVENVDESSENVLLFLSDAKGNEIIFPMHEDLLLEYSIKEKSMKMKISHELLNLNGLI